jgi:sugar-specific transcriptional regulator TrmB
VVELLREHGPQTVTELQLHGVPRARIHSTLRNLEVRGRVVVDSTVRPFRYAVAP